MQRLHSVCPHNCPDTCALIVDVDAAGTVVRVDGDPDHPVTRGFICEKVRRYPEHVLSERRVLYPKRRVGPKGAGIFERITWDEALATIAQRLHAAAAAFGPESILPYSYSGTLGILQSASMDRRFFHRLGASRLLRTICSTCAGAALEYTYGAAIGTDPEKTVDAQLIVVWGANIRTTNIHQFALVGEARRRGARLIVIDPHRNRTAETADRFIQPKPGTDAALALGMMHVLFRDGYADRDYLREHTIGAADLEARAADWPPERAGAISGVPAAEIVTLAHEYGAAKPAFIRAGYGLQRHTNGGMMVRTIAMLPAVTGAWRDPAGGFVLSNSGVFRYNRHALERPDLQPRPGRIINMIRLGEALTQTGDPPVKALFVYNSNPAAVAPDGNAVRRGLEREDLFTVVHDVYATDTARYADILLPAPTFLETSDVYTSYWHMHLQYAGAAIPPRGESRSNVDLFRALAKRMGFRDACFDDDLPELVRTMLDGSELEARGAGAERLLRERSVYVGRAPLERPISLRSDALGREGIDPLPTHVPLQESVDGSPELARRFPLAFLSPSHHLFLNSTFGSSPALLARGIPALRMHADDARARGIVSGDEIEVFNDRGRAQLRAEVSDAVAPGVVVHLSLWWNEFSPGGYNVNVTTSAAETDMGRGATFHTNLVEVKKRVTPNQTGELMAASVEDSCPKTTS